MGEESSFETITDVMADPKFAEIDCSLRAGRHIGLEDVSAHAFLESAFRPLSVFYRNYDCELVHDTHEESDFFYLSSYGKTLPTKKLSQQEMVTGMTLAFMLMDPEYISRKIPFERVIETMKMILGEETFRSRMAPRNRGKNTEFDDQKSIENVASAIRKLGSLGFLYWPRASNDIQPYSAIFRFLGPVRGLGNLEENIKILVNRGILELDQYTGEDDEIQEEA